MESSTLKGAYKEEKEHIDLPPGFRFHPTDEELIFNYLCSKTLNANFTAIAIGEADFNTCEPWDLPKVAKLGEKEWYFFSLKDRKYLTGVRANRATSAGYWKATGKDREIYKQRVVVGMKKTLIFYQGRAPRGEKTNWIMHEYRLHPSPKSVKNESVICRVFYKNSSEKKFLLSEETEVGACVEDGSCMKPIIDPNEFYQGYYPVNGAPYPLEVSQFIGSYSDDLNQGFSGGEMIPGTSSVVPGSGYDTGGDPFVDQVGCSGSMEPLDIDSIWNF